nr:hypothetical protein [Tanacetum cinerariifolium]
NKRQMETQESKIDLGKALDASLVVMESSGTGSGKHDTSSRSVNDADADADDAYIRSIYDEEPLVERRITILVKEANLRAKVKSYKTRNSNNPIEQKSHTQKPGRQIFTGYRFSPTKSSVVYEKKSHRSCLRWKPTGRIFGTVSLRWIPTGKLPDSCTGKVNSKPPHGSNVDIFKIHECKQSLDLSVGTSINVQKKQSIDLSARESYNVKKENLRVGLLKRMIS